MYIHGQIYNFKLARKTLGHNGADTTKTNMSMYNSILGSSWWNRILQSSQFTRYIRTKIEKILQFTMTLSCDSISFKNNLRGNIVIQFS